MEKGRQSTDLHCWIPFVGPAVVALQARARAQPATPARRQALRWLLLWAVAHLFCSFGAQQMAPGAGQIRFLYLDGMATTAYLGVCLFALLQWQRAR